MDISKKHHNWIDLLRFVSAFLVILAHFRGAFFVAYGLLPENQKNILVQIFYLMTRFGEESVIVFFVLSGFLVGGTSIEKILNNNVDIKAYIIDRSVRILLPLIASSILVVVIDLITHKPIPYIDIFGSLVSFQGVFTGSNHNPVLWSLSYEVWFYVLMGCIMVICRRKDIYVIVSFFIISICVYFFVMLKSLYLFIWFMGAFSFLIPREKYFKLEKLIIAIPILLVLLFISFVLSQMASESRSITINKDFLNRDVTSIAIALITCLLINYLVMSVPRTYMSIKIESLGSKLASFSYTLYLTHFPMIGLLTFCGFPKSTMLDYKSIFLYIVELLIGLVVAYLIFLLSENHTYRVKKLIKGT